MSIVTCSRRDCDYYSLYTDTCDYRLMNNGVGRGCSIAECDKYKPRDPDKKPNAMRIKPDYYESW